MSSSSYVIKQFCGSMDHPIRILEGVDRSESSVIDAYANIQECLAGKKLAKTALQSAREMDMAAAEPSILVLTLTAWAELSSRINQKSEAQALVHRAESMISDNSPAEIRACLERARGLLAADEGYFRNAEKHFKEAINMTVKHSQRREAFILELALFKARQGLLKDVSKLLPKELAKNAEGNRDNPWELIQFVDSVENGIEVAPLTQSTKTPNNKNYFKFAPWVSKTYRVHHLMNRIMHSQEPEAAPFDNIQMNKVPAYMTWAMVTHCLLTNKTDEALFWARQSEAQNRETVTGDGFSSYSLIRAELAAGNADAARRLIDLRQMRGNRHYLDNFFLARAESISRHTEQANELFVDAYRNAERYDALGRMDFELNLSCELKSGDVMRMMRSVSTATATQLRNRTASTPTRATRESQPFGIRRLVGHSRGLEAVKESITRFAELDVPVFITGDTGTGKELVARALHESSDRRGEKFIAINCGAIVDTLLESELFGHKKGAFTGAGNDHIGVFEEAGKGTLFLDEIGDISPRLQVALLRVLESEEVRPIGSSDSKKIKCRIIAATNADLEKKVHDGTFRNDLLFRLRRLEISLSPLAERNIDIIPIAQHFLDAGRSHGVHAELSKELRSALESYSWPGNVRELRNVIEQMRLLHSDKLQYELEDLDPKFKSFMDGVRPGKERPASSGSAPASPVATQGPALDGSGPLTIGKTRMRRLEVLKALFRQYKRLTRSEIIRTLNVSPNTATSDLKSLCADGFISKVMPNASRRTHYFEIQD